MAAGHVSDRNDAFDTLLGDGQPACVPRSGATPAEVAAMVRAAGGVASLAHPVLIRQQSSVPALASGLDAIEVHHSEHDAADDARYRALAAALRPRGDRRVGLPRRDAAGPAPSSA